MRANYVLGVGQIADADRKYLIAQPPLEPEHAECVERMTGAVIHNEDDRSVIMYRHNFYSPSELLQRGAMALRAIDCKVEIYTEMPLDESERIGAESLWRQTSMVPPVEEL